MFHHLTKMVGVTLMACDPPPPLQLISEWVYNRCLTGAINWGSLYLCTLWVSNRFLKVSKCVGLQSVLGKLYKCQHQHLFSRLTLVSYKEVLLINCSDWDLDKLCYHGYGCTFLIKYDRQSSTFGMWLLCVMDVRFSSKMTIIAVILAYYPPPLLVIWMCDSHQIWQTG